MGFGLRVNFLVKESKHIIRFNNEYIGSRRYPIESLKYTNHWAKKRKEEHEFYIKFKKLEQIRRRTRILSEYRKRSHTGE